MKATIPLLLFVLSLQATSQQTTITNEKLQIDYQKKSTSQKTIAWILAGTGVTTVIISIATFDGTEIFYSLAGNNKPINRFGALFFGGSAVALSSIPFFIISGKNKRKAMSLSFNIQQMPQLKQTSIAYCPIPSLKLKIRL